MRGWFPSANVGLLHALRSPFQQTSPRVDFCLLCLRSRATFISSKCLVSLSSRLAFSPPRYDHLSFLRHSTNTVCLSEVEMSSIKQRSQTTTGLVWTSLILVIMLVSIRKSGALSILEQPKSPLLHESDSMRVTRPRQTRYIANTSLLQPCQRSPISTLDGQRQPLGCLIRNESISRFDSYPIFKCDPSILERRVVAQALPPISQMFNSFPFR